MPEVSTEDGSVRRRLALPPLNRRRKVLWKFRRILLYVSTNFLDSPNHMSVIETGGKFVTYKLLERLVETFGVMPAALFFMPGAAPFDDTVQNKVNTIIKEELESAGVEIAKRIAKL